LVTSIRVFIDIAPLYAWLRKQTKDKPLCK
jgi:hypothetical protein